MKTFGRQPGAFRKNETAQEVRNGFLEKGELPVAHMPSESLLLGIFFFCL